MFSETDLNAEIRDVIAGQLTMNKTISPSWVCNAVIKARPLPEGPSSDFYRLCGFAHVRDRVRAVVREFRNEVDRNEQEQLTLPGYAFVQKAYSITRKGVALIVPIGRMTTTEMHAKAEELARQAAGCIAHSKELHRYATDERRRRRHKAG